MRRPEWLARGALRRADVGGSGGILVTFTAVRHMRFGEEGSDNSHPGSSYTAANVVQRPIPKSMMPKKLPSHFTPFPLPKYDESLGFGPVRLSNIPDIEAATQRLERRRKFGAAMALLTIVEEEGRTDADANEAVALGFLGATGDEGDSASLAASHKDAYLTGRTAEDGEGHPLGGYQVSERFPTIDRLECQRTLEDLLRQFAERPRRLARTATVIDLADSMQSRTNEELARMFYELGVLFHPNGNGLNFIAARVVKFGRPYAVTSELMKAYVHLVHCATETLVVEQPGRLQQCPELFIQLLHFLALIKVFEPNRWFTTNQSSMSNRADYKHPRGINNNTALNCVGEDLFDYMVKLVKDDPAGPTSSMPPLSLLQSCSSEQLVDLLAGFAAVMPDEKPEGVVANPVYAEFARRWALCDYELKTAADVATAERLLLAQRLVDTCDDALLGALLGCDVGRGGGVVTCSSLHLSPGLREYPRGPDFFCAVSRDRRPLVKACAVKLLRHSLAAATLAAGDGPESEPLVQALLESGTELLQTLNDTATAVDVCDEYGIDCRALGAIPKMETVAQRLSTQLSEVQRREDKDGTPSAGDAKFRGRPTDVQAAIQRARESRQHQRRPSYLTWHQGNRVHPIRTLLSDLTYINDMDNVFLLHSSSASRTVDQLIAAARRLRSGKDSLVVSMSCLRGLSTQAAYGTAERDREAAQRALDIVSYEMEMGRAVLVPTSEELRIHDAGVYCDEDLMLWTLAAFLARELPLVKVHTLMALDHPARRPYLHLKGGHTPLASSADLYAPHTPLLSSLRSKELRSITHHVQLQRPVRDRRSSLYYVNPSRTSFLYRRDHAMFDKYHVTARNLAPGFSQGAMASDTRGLGFYTPDHPQVPYKPLPSSFDKQWS